MSLLRLNIHAYRSTGNLKMMKLQTGATFNRIHKNIMKKIDTHARTMVFNACPRHYKLDCISKVIPEHITLKRTKTQMKRHLKKTMHEKTTNEGKSKRPTDGQATKTKMIRPNRIGNFLRTRSGTDASETTQNCLEISTTTVPATVFHQPTSERTVRVLHGGIPVHTDWRQTLFNTKGVNYALAGNK